jgi:lon-related putative ATP-dependent protease
MPNKRSRSAHSNQAIALKPTSLHRPCRPANLGFKTTDELPDLSNVIGQPRALRSLEIGSEVPGAGYNIYVLGLPGSGRTTLSREYLERKAAALPVPNDWAYVNNFNDLHRPIALRLPAGLGAAFQKDIQELIQHCRQEIPRVFESEEYTHARDRLVNELKKRQETEFIRLQEYVEKYNFTIVRAPFGFILLPAIEGKPLKPEEVDALSPEQRAKLSELQSRLGEEVEKSINRIREIERATTEQLAELNNRTVTFVVGPLIGKLIDKYVGIRSAVTHLEAILADVINNAGQFRSAESAQSDPATLLAEREWVRRYEVNLIVDNSSLKGAPVIVENYPSYNNLIGRIEHEAIMGASRTDFTMIRPGALHRAGGGYLVLPVRDVLINPFAWEALKRALRDRELRIVELANQLGYLSTVTLEPEPIPLDVKVVLVGTPMLYYLLRTYDEDFAKLFKVRAEFTSVMERSTATEREYGLFVKSVVEDNALLPFDNTAVARLIEYSARLSGDQNKLSTRFGKISDLVREASYWAAKNSQKIVKAGSVEQAISESNYRSNLVEERLQELILEGTLLIDIDGAKVGQMNALSVYLLGDYEFGRPNRVTAVAYPGRTGVIDIERQAKLGGAIHTKGVLILSSLLNARYGRSQPLSLSASLTFEQSYDEVEGDSASAAELYAVLSSLAEIPLRQDRAVTGSINQLGQIQPVGGINEKIEGFFAVCKARGLTGDQGVIIPAANQRNLMLSREVIQAVRNKQFHIWTIRTVDEGIPILTGFTPGERQPDGVYPPGTFHAIVTEKIAEFNKILQASTNKSLSKPTSGEQDGKNDDTANK